MPHCHDRTPAVQRHAGPECRAIAAAPLFFVVDGSSRIIPLPQIGDAKWHVITPQMEKFGRPNSAVHREAKKESAATAEQRCLADAMKRTIE
jgi:hypothetical protein